MLHLDSCTGLKTFEISCPYCSAPLTAGSRLKWEGMLTWSECRCASCRKEFDYALPVAHAARFPVYRSPGQKVESAAELQWLVQAWNNSEASPLSLEYQGQASSKILRVFNCLDPCYGHALLRLLQVFPWLQHPEYDVLVLAPARLQWFIPESVKQRLLVHGPMKALAGEIQGLSGWMDAHLASHPHWQWDTLPLNFDYERLSLEPFLGAEYQIPKAEAATLVIHWRKDRFWMQSRAGEALAWCYYKYRWSWLQSWLEAQQLRNFKNLVRKVRQQVPGLSVYLVGMGKPKMLHWAIDERAESPDAETEKQWCRRYAQAGLVVGIHGSHMLLPSLLSQGIVELLPDWKINHWGEDVLFLKKDLEKRTRCRMVPTRSSTQRVTAHVLALLKWWPLWYDEKKPGKAHLGA
ncbi:MAG: hypothetical protein MUF42_17125 [Cytophagaceae bacterium]|jgi:hypothetical protein|nr:hypothetical protein [Cytophagaceae bacterium]